MTITTVDSGAALGHIVLMPDGYVGIGTVTPRAALDVAGGVIVGEHNVANASFHIERYSNTYPYAFIYAGYADNNLPVGMKFVPRDAAGVSFVAMTLLGTGFVGIGTETPDKLLTLKDQGDAGSKTFSAGWAGTGWYLDWLDNHRYHLELESMTIRGALNVYELIINTIHSVDGGMIISKGHARAASVSGAHPNETIIIEDPSGHGASPFKKGDIVMVQRVAVDDTSVVRKEQRQVKENYVSGLTLTLEATAGGEDNANIQAGDVLVVLGNIEGGDGTAGRDASIFLSASEGNNPFIRFKDGVHSVADWNGATKIVTALGNLNGVYGYDAEIYGFAAGNPSGPNVTIDPTNGIRFRVAEVDYAVLTGTAFTMYSGPATGKRIVIGTDTYPDPDYSNALVFYKDATTEVVRIDDSIYDTLGGMKITGGVVSVVAGGNYTVLYDDHIRLTGQVRTGYGTVLLPAFTFQMDSDTGIYRVTDNELGISANHTAIAKFTSSSVFLYKPLDITGGIVYSGVMKAPNGAVGAPSYAFAGDLDNGLYLFSANMPGIAAGGVLAARFDATWGIRPGVLQTTATAANLQCTGTNSPIKRSTAGRRKDKENIRDIEIDTSKIYDLNPISFASKLDLDKNDKPIDGFFGLVAEEVHETLPNLCGYNERGELDWVQYQMLPVLMLPEMKKLRSRITDLEAEVATLKTQIAIA